MVFTVRILTTPGRAFSASWLKLSGMSRPGISLAADNPYTLKSNRIDISAIMGIYGDDLLILTILLPP
jgi:hypothetical protein